MTDTADLFERLEAQTKHLPGLHDQRTHGRRRLGNLVASAVDAVETFEGVEIDDAPAPAPTPAASPAPPQVKRLLDDLDRSKKVSPLVRSQLEAGLRRLDERYPELVQHTKELSARKLDRKTYATTTREAKNQLGDLATVELNSYFTKKDLTAQQRADEWEGYSSPTGDASGWESILTHEYGHVAQAALGMMATDVWLKTAAALGLTVSSRGLDARNEVAKRIAWRVSRYAGTSDGETWAELFAEYVLSPTPRRDAQAFGQALDAALQKTYGLERLRRQRGAP